MNPKGVYTTGDELDFLRILATDPRRSVAERIQLLERYRASLARRRRWERIDRQRVDAAVSELLGGLRCA